MHRSGQLRSSVGTQTVPAAADSNEDLAYEPPPVDDDVDVAFLASQARRLATFRAESRLTDLVVCVGTERFACHRLHLCAASSFFRALFTSAMRDASSESITLEEIAPSVFGTVLEYVYTGHCTLTADDVVDVLAAADRLAVIELRERCTRFLQRNLTAQNALAAYDVASSLSITRLKESALRVALEQFDEVAASPSFVDVPADFLKQLFASDELRAAEECVFRALSAWYHHQLDERVDDASALLQLVRLPLCEPAFLEGVVEKDGLGQLPVCKELLLEAYSHLNLSAAMQRVQLHCAPRAPAGRDWLREVFEMLGPRSGEGYWASTFKGHGGGGGARGVAVQPESRRRRRMAAAADVSPLSPSRGHVRTIKALCVDEEAGVLYTGSWDHTARKWGLRTGACLLTFTGHKQDVIGMHLCRERARLFTCADRVRCWSTLDGSCVRIFGTSTFYCAVADERALYAAQYDGQILQFDHLPAEGGSEEEARGGCAAAELEVRTPVCVLTGHESGVMGFDLRGDLLVSASIDSTAKAWSRATAECTQTFVGHTSQLRAVQLWRDSVLTGSYDQTIRQWDLESGAQLRLFAGHTDAIRALVVGVDLMSCYMWSASSDGTVRQWDLESGAQVLRLSAHEESVFALAHADGVLYTGSADCTAKRFDVHTGKCIMTFPRREGPPHGAASGGGAVAPAGRAQPAAAAPPGPAAGAAAVAAAAAAAPPPGGGWAPQAVGGLAALAGAGPAAG